MGLERRIPALSNEIPVNALPVPFWYMTFGKRPGASAPYASCNPASGKTTGRGHRDFHAPFCESLLVFGGRVPVATSGNAT